VSGSRTQSGSPQVAPSSLPATPSGRKPGKQPGAKGVWRSAPLEAEGTRNHFPAACAICGTVFELWDPNHSAHFVLDLEPVGGGIRIACLRHIHHATQCACGTAARPGMGVLIPGRSRDLLLSEACLRHWPRSSPPCRCATTFRGPGSPGRMVRGDAGTLDRCIREVGVACEPVVETLLDARPG
jgi:transposase